MHQANSQALFSYQPFCSEGCTDGVLNICRLARIQFPCQVEPNILITVSSALLLHAHSKKESACRKKAVTFPIYKLALGILQDTSIFIDVG